MQKHAEWLLERLPEWEAEGLLNSETAGRLRERYEKEGKPVASRGNLATLIVSAVGALLIGLGVIALFAANWPMMTRGIRSIVSLLPLTVCTVLAFVGFERDWKSRAFWEALGIFLTLSIWSGFGLVCQTYHMSDNVSGFVLACTLLCLPILYLTQSAVATIAWPIYGLVWMTMKDGSFSDVRILCYLVMLAVHLPIFLAIHRRIKLRGTYEFFGTVVLSAGVLGILLNSCRLWHNSSDMIVLLATVWLGVTLWILSAWTKWRSMRVIGFLYLLPVVFVAPISNIHSSFSFDNDLEGVLFAFLTVLVCALGGFLLGQTGEVIAKLPPNRQNAASEGEERKRSVVTTPSLSDEAIAPSREGGWDERFAITSGERRLTQEKRLQLIVLLIAYLAVFLVYWMHLPQFCVFLLILLVSGLALAQALRNLLLFQMNLSLCVLMYEILVKYLATDWSFTIKGVILLACGAALLVSNIFLIRGRRQAKKEVEK
ncbi:MAG: DUF2157 domain-containing protein [Victivallales bacterium]|nr:DUF2157 domain-containing protein [Victivallales bacterium]